MILLNMLRARWVQALTMFLFSAAATFATMAGPAYLRHVDAHIVAQEYADAPMAERRLTLSGQATGARADGGSGLDVLDVMTALIPPTGFTAIAASEFTGFDASKPSIATRYVDRQDICAHVAITAGRCLVGVGEAILPADLATRLGVRVGQIMPVTFKIVQQFDSQGNQLYYYSGTLEPTQVTVAGIYRPLDTTSDYWGTRDYFNADQPPTVFVNDTTFAALLPDTSVMTVDAIARVSALADPAALSAALQNVVQQVSNVRGGIDVKTGLPTLLARTRANRSAANQVVLLGAVPLVALAWFVVFLASSYGAAARRVEFANIALRGTPLLLRWWLAIGEGVLAVVAGAIAGVTIGSIWLSVPVIWPLIALGGSLLAVLFAQVKLLATPVNALLRNATGGRFAGGLRRAGEVLVVLIGAAAYVLMRSQRGSLTGITLLVPALVILSTAVIASLAVTPLARGIGRWAMRRGWVATAFAAYQIGRRAGARRLLILLTVSLALLAYGLAGLSIATGDRFQLSVVRTGAPRVLDVNVASRAQLLAGVRAADPAGRWAMAVVASPPASSAFSDSGPVSAPTLAVDAPRLAAVASWLPAFGPLSAAQIAARLHPSGYAGAPTFRGTSLVLTGTVTDDSTSANMLLGIVVLPADGSGAVTATTRLRAGPLAATFAVPCANGCRFAQFDVIRTNSAPYRVRVAITSATVGSKPVLDMATGGRWHIQSGHLATSAHGITATLNAPSGEPVTIWVRPDDAPVPLPAVSTTTVPATSAIAGLDGRSLQVVPVATVTALPQLGLTGTLIDLEYADLSTADSGAPSSPQVWLGSHAPADAIARLAARGIVVTGATDAAANRHELDEEGAVLALRYHLFAGLLGVLLTIGVLIMIAATDREPRSTERRAMRVQGMSRRTMARAARGGYAIVALTAAGLGLGAAALAWRLTSAALPIYADTGIWPAPHWPSAVAVGVPWVAAAVLLVAVALGIGADLRRMVSRP